MPLIPPSESTVVDEVNFSVDPSLVRKLGTESVSDKVLSVIELVKNSYDADATEVNIELHNFRTGEPSIRVIDNGSGMDIDDLVGKWMRIATSWKKTSRTTKNGRKMLGLKGIGRFAVENLSSITKIYSYPEGKDQGIKIEFNWDLYKNPNVDINSIKTNIEQFRKSNDDKGTIIELNKLNHHWEESDVYKLRQYLRSLLPPYDDGSSFKVKLRTEEFSDLAGEINSDFLSKALYTFTSELDRRGNIEYSFTKYGIAESIEKSSKFKSDFKCGPLKLYLYFYYKQKKRMENYGINIDDMKVYTNILDSYGNIKIYRDGIRLSGFGNPDDDWAGLDTLSRDDPSVVPARDNIISSIHISTENNPDLTDTTTRENIIKNKSFMDMLDFIKDSISVFSQIRAELEGKRGKVSTPRYIEKVRDALKKRSKKAPLLDYTDKYPYKTFYPKLEDEINACYKSNLPNATLILSRKLIENLLYNILERKYPRQPDLWYDTRYRRTLDFFKLIVNIDIKKDDFPADQRDLIVKLLGLFPDFRREANSTTHKIIDYINDSDDLDNLKITDIVELELELFRKVTT
jgi:hypothetical protein